MKRPRKKRRAVIADDLSGAMDAATAFVKCGFTADVVLDRRALGGSAAEIAVLCTHSRHDRPAAARRKVRRACAQLHRSGRSLVYKKLDSTAQGNLVAEVEAARDAGGFAAALVCVANPAQGRRVRGSALQVRGAPTVDLHDRFRAQRLRRFGVVAAPPSFAQASAALPGGHRFLSASATTVRHLEHLALAVRRSRRPILAAGSAALAAALAKLLRPEDPLASSAGVPPAVSYPAGVPPSSRPVLIISGSANPATTRQLAAFLRRTQALRLPLNPRTASRAAAALAARRPVVILAPVHRQPDRTILRQLGALTPLFRGRLIGGLLLTGGDTAALVCRCLRPRAIAIGGEFAPGLAWGRFRGGLADGLAVCTKPGGFGRDQSLVRAARFLSTA